MTTKLFGKKQIPITQRRRTVGEKIWFTVMWVLFFVYSLTLIFALVWTFLNSLKTHREFIRDTMSLPLKWLFSNYLDAFRLLSYNDNSYFQMMFNTLWYAFGSVAVGAFASSCTSYVFAKYNIKFKEFWFSFIIFTMMIPIYGAGTMTYKIIYGLHLNDTPLYLVCTIGGFGGTFLVMYGYWKGVDSSFMDAAFIDGAGRFYTFVKIMLPLAKPPLFAICLTSLLGAWNDYGTSLLYLKKYTMLATGLYAFETATMYAANKPVYFAGVLMSLFPVLTIFAIFNGKIMNNIVLGGLKG